MPNAIMAVAFFSLACHYGSCILVPKKTFRCKVLFACLFELAFAREGPDHQKRRGF